jgi:predicted dehydrogenase
MNQKRINVALVGHKFMGKAHSHAYRDVAMFFPGVEPRMRVVCGLGDDLAATAATYGWDRAEPSWQNVVEDPDVDVVDICTPDRLHHEVALAAIRNGKHVFCEKPLALTLAEAREMHDLARGRGVVHMVNFVYRGLPAVQLARKLIADGRIGRIYQFKGLYQQDFSLGEDFPFVWRMDRTEAGHGVLADKGAHVIDLARYLVGEIESVACRTQTFVKERRVPGGGETRQVTTNDAAVFVAAFANGAIGTFELSNMCAGSKNGLVFEVNGSEGSIRFDLERLNELEVYLAGDLPELRGFRRILATSPAHPYISHWWPEGHVLGWEHGFIHMVQELLQAIAQARPATPSFLEGLRCQEVVEALARADRERSWVSVG